MYQVSLPLHSKLQRTFAVLRQDPWGISSLQLHFSRHTLFVVRVFLSLERREAFEKSLLGLRPSSIPCYGNTWQQTPTHESAHVCQGIDSGREMHRTAGSRKRTLS